VPNFPRDCVKIARGNHQTESSFPTRRRNFKDLRQSTSWHFFCMAKKLTCGRVLAGPALAIRRTPARRDETSPSWKENIFL
jgi:hypothetical protein